MSAAPPVSRGYSYYVLAALFAVYVFNFVDRQVLSILVGLGLGPAVIGWFNDQLAASQGAAAIRGSLLFVALMGGLAAPFFWLGSRHLRADLDR